jgi:propionyl-CoA carboxylase alpha chain
MGEDRELEVNHIRKVLVANRGEIAVRVMRAARELDIATVAVFSPADIGAPFVALADESVALSGSAPSESYLDIEQLLRAAALTGADAVHPGYGFLSERAEFAECCRDADLTFIGPSVKAIESMGSKVAAKELMASAGVPVLPGITLGSNQDLEDLLRTNGELDLPALVKAAYGGGGRGMRIVRHREDLVAAVESGQREALSAFGDGTVFIERYVEAPRHIEVQIVGDTRGDVVHLFERECSVQRRYQKILEEAPSPVVGARLRGELVDAAVRAGRALSYCGVGTVEFVLDGTNRFYFLEVNTRLQVEHPVTEMVTGIDLVKLQFRIAEGYPLPREVREAKITGHAVEARLYAEDPSDDYRPSPGTIHRFRFPSAHGLRVDSGVQDGSVVGPHYDAMLAKVIAHAPDRVEACRKVASALRSAEIHGPATNRDLLIGILNEPSFLSGDIDTTYLHRLGVPNLIREARVSETGRELHAVAAALTSSRVRRSQARVLRTASSGWRNVPTVPQSSVYVGEEDDRIEVRYGFWRTDIVERRRLVASVNDVPLNVLLHDLSDSFAVLEVDRVRRTIRVHRIENWVFVDSPFGSTALREEPRFLSPVNVLTLGSLVAPMPGTVVRVEVAVGDRVEAGSPIIVLEAMKMEHVVSTPTGGVVTDVYVSSGQGVDAGVMLAVVSDGNDHKE